MSNEQPHYIWRVEKRKDGIYAVHQFGGWMKFDDRAVAEEYIDRQIKRHGDERKTEQ